MPRLRLPLLCLVWVLLCAGLTVSAQRPRDRDKPPAPAAPAPKPAAAAPTQQLVPPTPVANPQDDTQLTEAEAAAMLSRLDSLQQMYQGFARYSHRLVLDANHPYAPGDSSVPRFPPDVVAARLADLPSQVPLDYNPTVHRFIDAYTVRLRPLLTRLVGMQYVYFPLIEEIFEREGVPTELKYLCVIESAFNNRARSRAAAVGLWQFMYGTAKLYGLRMDDYVDERQDPYKSTVAAARYLKHMYAVYKDWHLVIAAYNCGPGRINRAIRTSGGKRDYWQIIRLLPLETRGYVPSYIAASYALNYYAEHNIRPVWVDFAFEDSIHVRNQELALADLAGATGADTQLLRDMNPALRLGKVPYSSQPFIVRVPNTLKAFLAQHPDTLRRIKPTTNATPELLAASLTVVPVNARKLVHTVRRGQTYASIARAYGVSAESLMRWNHAGSTGLEIGQRLVIYKTGATPRGSGGAVAVRGSTYRVRKGDTLWGIAQKHGVTIEQLRRANKMSRSSRIATGQTLRIPR